GLLFIGVTMALTWHIPATLKFWLHGNPDIGAIMGGYLGTLVLGMVYLSIGLFASSLTGDQIVAFVIASSISLFFFLIGDPEVREGIRDWNPAVASTVERFGVTYHFESIARGVVDTRDIIYAVTISGFFLFLTVLVIERRR